MPSPFTSKHIEKEREWVDPIPVRVGQIEVTRRDFPSSLRRCALANASKTTGEGLNPLWLCRNASKTGGEGIEPSPFASKRVESGQKETGRGGALPIC